MFDFVICCGRPKESIWSNSRVRKPHVGDPNLGIRFLNECSVRLNLRRMDRFISMVILAVNPRVAQWHGGYLELRIRESAIERE